MANIIIPEVFSSAVNEKMSSSLRMARVAYDATSSVPEITTAGDVCHFPTLNRVAVATTVTKGTALTPATLDMTDNTATIKQVATSVRIFDVEQNQIKGNALDNIVTQVSDAMAKQVDFDLAAAIDTDAVYKTATTGATAITSAEIESGIANFGDSIDTDSFAGIVINSRLYPSFVGMSEFVDSTKTYMTNGNGLVKDGVVGYWMGIPIILDNTNSYDSTKAECKTYILKKNALGYIFQKNISVEEQRNALLLANDIVASSLYACKLIDLKGAVVLRKTVA